MLKSFLQYFFIKLNNIKTITIDEENDDGFCLCGYKHKINDVYYLNDYVYYKSGNKLKYYSNSTGNRTIVEYDEIEFNNSLVFGVYIGK